MAETRWQESTEAWYENSFGRVTEPETVVINYHLKISDISGRGHFEMYSDDERYYAEGMIRVAEDEQGKYVEDFDGVFDLPKAIKIRLAQWDIQCRWDN